ncbi:MAG: ABC transporter permease [Anaerolineales bacterium]
MSDVSVTLDEETTLEEARGTGTSTVARVAKYAAFRLVILFFAVVVAIYLTVLIANMGGYVDEIRRGEIRNAISLQIYMSEDPELKKLSSAEKKELVDRRVTIEEKRRGLDQPFIIRSFAFLKNALTLNLGFAEDMMSDSGSKQVRLILLERLPPTLILWGAGNILLFFFALFTGLYLSRNYGSFLDKLIVALVPTSSAPAWFYGLFLIIIFAGILQVLPFGGLVDAPPPSNKLLYALSVLKHLILPTSAIFISSIAISTFNRRVFFLIYSQEDYVEMAKAKGVSDRTIERRYILRPTLPPIITGFLLLVIAIWMGATILETVFNWPGLGQALFKAIGLFDTPVIVGSNVIYAYLLAATVFFLDFIYALVDPRVRIGEQGRKV